MSDKNVKIVAGGTTYYFPHSTVNRRLDKQINEIQTPKKSTGFDLLMSSDGYSITGRWLDDHEDKDYDSKTAFQRYLAWVEYWKETGGQATLTWSSGTGATKATETETVMVRYCDFNKDSGDGQIIEYNLRLAIVKVRPNRN